MDEDALVELIRRAAAGPAPAGVVLGIGDDAALLEGGVVLAADVLVEDVHFERARLAPREIGYRAAASNLSDMAAMGAEPRALLSSLVLPPGFDGVEELAAGLAEHGVPLVGGDLSRGPLLVVSIAIVGRAERPVLRSGGRPGDVLAVTGTLGVQALSGYTSRPTPRLAEGRALAGVATAMIDVSDGIASDVRRLAQASGTGAVVRLEALPRAAGATAELAATGGEDYELLAALPPGVAAPVPVTVVGELTADPRVRLLDAGGHEVALSGWEHFP